MYLARLPAGNNTPQIFEVEAPGPTMREERFYTPRAWNYGKPGSVGSAALDVSPAKAVKRLTTHLQLEKELQDLIRRPILSAAQFATN